MLLVDVFEDCERLHQRLAPFDEGRHEAFGIDRAIVLAVLLALQKIDRPSSAETPFRNNAMRTR